VGSGAAGDHQIVPGHAITSNPDVGVKGLPCDFWMMRIDIGALVRPRR
jgi:hypothetical protein